MQKVKILLVISVGLLFLLVVVYGTLLMVRRGSSPAVPQAGVATPDGSPIPSIQIDEEFASSDYAYPKMSKILSSTGANDEEAAEVDTAANQRGSLLSALPVQTANFTVTMDYAKAKYVVTFVDLENEDNLATFELWLADNYADLKPEEFEFQ